MCDVLPCSVTTVAVTQRLAGLYQRDATRLPMTCQFRHDAVSPVAKAVKSLISTAHLSASHNLAFKDKMKYHF
jgi:hypothetical protein